jgi:integrase
MKLALRLVRVNYSRSSVAEFGPLALKAVREAMIEADWSRPYVNHQINRIRRAFKWGVENELVPPSVLQALQAVAPLRYGRTEARETEPVRPVPDAYVDAVLPIVAPQVAAMIRLQRLTGMRPGEAVIMRGMDLDTSGKVWVYRPSGHKNKHRGHERLVCLGPQAQEVVKPFLRSILGEYLFRPNEAAEHHRAMRHAARKTPLSCGNRPGTSGPFPRGLLLA